MTTTGSRGRGVLAAGTCAAGRHENERTPDMTCRTAPDSPAASQRGLAGRIRAARDQLSARVHAAADDRARANGWTITESTGRFGMGARTYRDPRFSTRPRATSTDTPPRRRAA
jgi:hypothetical protein